MKLQSFGLYKLAFLIVCTWTSSALSAPAQNGDWYSYSDMIEGKKTCYIYSYPIDSEGNFSKRGNPYISVTKVNPGVFEVSVTSGYPYKKNSEVLVSIDGKNYQLFSDGEYAWNYSENQDKTMVSAMKQKYNLSVKGTSLKGTYSLDKYSLKGFTASFNKMDASCK